MTPGFCLSRGEEASRRTSCPGLDWSCLLTTTLSHGVGSSLQCRCGLRHVAGPKAAGHWNHFGPQRVRREGRECGTQSHNSEKHAGKGTRSC